MVDTVISTPHWYSPAVTVISVSPQPGLWPRCWSTVEPLRQTGNGAKYNLNVDTQSYVSSDWRWDTAPWHDTRYSEWVVQWTSLMQQCSDGLKIQLLKYVSLVHSCRLWVGDELTTNVTDNVTDRSRSWHIFKRFILNLCTMTTIDLVNTFQTISNTMQCNAEQRWWCWDEFPQYSGHYTHNTTPFLSLPLPDYSNIYTRAFLLDLGEKLL